MKSLLSRIPSNDRSRTVFAALGLACYLRIMLQSYFLFRAGARNGIETPNALFAFFVVLLAATFALMAIQRDRVDKPLLGSPAFSLAAYAACAAGCCLLRWALLASVGNMLVLSLLTALYAIGLAASLCAWGAVLYRLDQRHAHYALFGSFVAYSAFSLLSAIGVHGLGAVLTSGASVAMLFCWIFSYSDKRFLPPRSDIGLLKNLPGWQTAVLVACIYICIIVIGMLSIDEPGNASAADCVAAVALPLSLGLAFIVGIRSPSRALGREGKFDLVVTVAGAGIAIAVLLVTIAFSVIQHDVRLPITLIGIARRFCIVGVLAICSKVMHEKAISPTLLFSLAGLMCFTLPLMLGRFTVPAFDALNENFLSSYEALVILVLSAVLIFATFALLLVARVMQVDEPQGNDAQLRRSDAFDSVIRDFGLTERESEIMELIVEGDTMRRIGEKLFISLGTVQTHSKNLYRKLDIHSKQELLDLIKSRMG